MHEPHAQGGKQGAERKGGGKVAVRDPVRRQGHAGHGEARRAGIHYCVVQLGPEGPPAGPAHGPADDRNAERGDGHGVRACCKERRQGRRRRRPGRLGRGKARGRLVHKVGGDEEYRHAAEQPADRLDLAVAVRVPGVRRL